MSRTTRSAPVEESDSIVPFHSTSAWVDFFDVPAFDYPSTEYDDFSASRNVVDLSQPEYHDTIQDLWDNMLGLSGSTSLPGPPSDELSALWNETLNAGAFTAAEQPMQVSTVTSQVFVGTGDTLQQVASQSAVSADFGNGRVVTTSTQHAEDGYEVLPLIQGPRDQPRRALLTGPATREETPEAGHEAAYEEDPSRFAEIEEPTPEEVEESPELPGTPVSDTTAVGDGKEETTGVTPSSIDSGTAANPASTVTAAHVATPPCGLDPEATTGSPKVALTALKSSNSTSPSTLTTANEKITGTDTQRLVLPSSESTPAPPASKANRSTTLSLQPSSAPSENVKQVSTSSAKRTPKRSASTDACISTVSIQSPASPLPVPLQRGLSQEVATLSESAPSTPAVSRRAESSPFTDSPQPVEEQLPKSGLSKEILMKAYAGLEMMQEFEKRNGTRMPSESKKKPVSGKSFASKRKAAGEDPDEANAAGPSRAKRSRNTRVGAAATMPEASASNPTGYRELEITRTARRGSKYDDALVSGHPTTFAANHSFPTLGPFVSMSNGSPSKKPPPRITRPLSSAKSPSSAPPTITATGPVPSALSLFGAAPRYTDAMEDPFSPLQLPTAGMGMHGLAQAIQPGGNVATMPWATEPPSRFAYDTDSGSQVPGRFFPIGFTESLDTDADLSDFGVLPPSEPLYFPEAPAQMFPTQVQLGELASYPSRVPVPDAENQPLQASAQPGRLATTTAIRRPAKNPQLYECRYKGCERKFTDPSTRTRHLETHWEFRRYACTGCGLRAKRRLGVQRHIHECPRTLSITPTIFDDQAHAPWKDPENASQFKDVVDGRQRS